MSDLDLDELRAELDEFSEAKKAVANRTPREERIVAGFEDIERFIEQHGNLPTHGEDRDIFERLYAVRLDRIRASEECRVILEGLDKNDILEGEPMIRDDVLEEIDDDELLAELEALGQSDSDITNLKHVKTRAEIRAAEEIARRTPCLDFNKFKPLFLEVQDDLKSGARQTREFKDDANIHLGNFFILSGQKVYVAEMGEEFVAEYGRPDRRLRVIYDNGTESDILMRSLQRALNKDETGRRITDPSAGPLFSDVHEDNDQASGTIYVLRSKSDHPLIKENQNIIHKIGVTSGDVKKRVANAKLDPTFLMADVDVVATYELSNINRAKLEKIIHRVFDPAKLDIEIADRFGNPITPREWFLVPFFVIDEAVEKIKDGSIINYAYKPSEGKLVLRK